MLGGVVYLHFAGALTHLAPSSEEPGDQLLVVDGGRNGLVVGRTALRCRCSGIPPNVAVSDFLPEAFDADLEALV